MIPPSASTSRTTVPFATPPIAGLQDICPMVSSELVMIPTRAPSRAAATAASVPAWPAPTTSTSSSLSTWPLTRGALIIESYIWVAGRTSADRFRRGQRVNIIRPFQEPRMPLDIPATAPTLLIRKAAFDASALTRAAFDERLNLTADEFRVEGSLIAIGPLSGDEAVSDLIDELEEAGLTYFDDFFELSGNWPEWLRLYAMSTG